MGADRDVVRRCLGGDQSACEELVFRYQDRALRTAIGILGDQQLAQDAVQEAFIRCFRGLSRLDGRVAFSTWLYQAVVWAARTQARSWRRWLALLRRQPELGPESSFADSDRRLSVVTALGQLPLKLREVIVLRYYLDLTEAEAARILGCPVGTVKSRTAASLERLRRFTELSDLLTDSDVGGISSVRP